MESIILIVHVVLALAVVGLVLLQHGKGADAGASFGSGASQTVFGGRGSGSFLTRMTAVLAALFFVTSFALAIYAKQQAARIGDIGIPEVIEVAPVNNTLPKAEDALPDLEKSPSSIAPAELMKPADQDIPKVNE